MLKMVVDDVGRGNQPEVPDVRAAGREQRQRPAGRGLEVEGVVVTIGHLQGRQEPRGLGRRSQL